MHLPGEKNEINSESIVRKEMDLATAGISCSGKVRISLSIAWSSFLILHITNLGEEVNHDPSTNGTKQIVVFGNCTI